MVELRLRCPQPLVEALSDALLGWGALSASVLDADADSPSEQALYAEPGFEPSALGWNQSHLQALFATRRAAGAAQRRLRASPAFNACLDLGLHAVAEQDWVRQTQAQFEPVAITPAFWICPSWRQRPAQAKQFIVLDPGLAFGTGTHATTRMCLRWIAAHAPRGLHVLDYGCGSGILAIAAAKFGAAKVLAVDIDPVAVETAANNAQANQVAIQTGLPDAVAGDYDVVIANILATPLKVLAPLLSAHVARGGVLLLSGILERQSQDLIATYQPYLPLRAADADEGWALLSGQAGS